MHGKIGLGLLAGLFTMFAALAADDPPGSVAFPIERLQLEWMRQDARRLDVSACFVRTDSCELEQQMVRKVLNEVQSRGTPATVEADARELAFLVSEPVDRVGETDGFAGDLPAQRQRRDRMGGPREGRRMNPSDIQRRQF